MARSKTLAPSADVTRSILVLRSHKVLLDEDLATLYGVETKVLIQAVKRNAARFPADFMFQLTAPEWAALRSQIVTSKTPVAAAVATRRTPSRSRAWPCSPRCCAATAPSPSTSRSCVSHDEAIAAILSAIRELMNPPLPKRRPIGFTADLSQES